MSPDHARKSWRQRCRKAARGCAILLAVALVAAVASLIYLNQVGLPDFVKNPLLAELRARGLDLEFSRLRLRWNRGIVAENINVGSSTTPTGPQLFIDQAEVHLSHPALRRLRLEIDALVVHRGRITLPLPQAGNLAPQQLNLDDISSELRLLPDDRWQLANLQAQCLGAQLRATGALTHASAVRTWKLARTGPPPVAQWLQTLRRALAQVEQLRFTTAPQIQLNVQVDARRLSSFKTDCVVTFDRATGPDLFLDKVLLSAHCLGPTNEQDLLRTEINLRAEQAWLKTSQADQFYLSARFANTISNLVPEKADWHLRATRATTPWASSRAIRVAAQTSRWPTNGTLQTELTLEADAVHNQWAQTRRLELKAQLAHRLSQPAVQSSNVVTASPIDLWEKFWSGPYSPQQLKSNLRLDQVETRWGQVSELRTKLELARAPASVIAADRPGWAYWGKLEPLELDWGCQFDNLHTALFRLQALALTGQWRAPTLTLNRIWALLYDGQLEGGAQLNTVSRELRTQAAFDFDVHQVGLLLNTNGQRWIGQFDWQQPPLVRGKVGLRLPAWTNAHPDWRADVVPTLWVDGYAESGPSSFRGASASGASLHFTLSNSVWHIPDLVAIRPEGALELEYTENSRSHDYTWVVNSHIDPKALLPLLGPAPQRAMNFFTFDEPPEISGRVWGRWHAPEQLAFKGQVAITNFAFRGETCRSFNCGVRFTNNFLEATAIKVRRDQGETIDTPRITLDLTTKRLSFDHAQAHLDPLVITRAIGPKTTKAILPYHFDQPPSAEVNGWLELPGPEHTDLRFDLSGGPFQYWKLHSPSVTGTVLWQNDTVTITNLQAVFYQGSMTGWLAADLAPTNGTTIQFQSMVTNADLHLMLQDVYRGTNKLEGLLSGQLSLTHLDSWDWQSWQGQGRVALRQGLIWDIPLFGIVSPMLNAIVPGLGNSRASEGTASFTIKDSVIYTKDLQIRSPALRLYYDGAIDFQGRVNARVEASLLRNVPGFGLLFSLVLSPVTKIFEYKVTGTLTAPQSKPVYILPQLILAPFHPIRTLKGLFGHEDNKPSSPPPAQK